MKDSCYGLWTKHNKHEWLVVQIEYKLIKSNCPTIMPINWKFYFTILLFTRRSAKGDYCTEKCTDLYSFLPRECHVVINHGTDGHKLNYKGLVVHTFLSSLNLTYIRYEELYSSNLIHFFSKKSIFSRRIVHQIVFCTLCARQTEAIIRVYSTRSGNNDCSTCN